ncbi:RHS repeat-associated core domain-containing protein [Pseudomonas sp. Ant30-3]|uniref:RHS repeat-associated core domain-containing protein n=1 Tax=Pseudomonas sp. Ant30-3 TaxID=1488328 RepID=UPI00067E0B43|nr:RHS repeat-associated core domain-containing protein [Pseudomonas sp. Ant30-3]
MWKAANDEFASSNVVPINKTTCPLRFPGQYYDEESGLHYNRHRYYDPETAQYLSPDPLGLGGGVRPQGYVDNPNCWIDPSGLSDENIFIHYTNQSGFENIMKTGVLEPNTKGKVYISNVLMSPKDVMRDILINDPMHSGKGDYSIIFKADAAQLSNIVKSSELEYIHSGRLKIGEILHAGKNPYSAFSHISYEQRLKLTQEQIDTRGKNCG